MRKSRMLGCDRKRGSIAGFTLVETVVATAIMCTLAAGILVLAATALETTENQGHLTARTTEYCQDKMEQLLALAYNDSTSNTAVIPTSSSGGNGLAAGGSSNPASPVAGYLDYLDTTGNLLTFSGTTPPANWFYERVWSVAAGPVDATNTKLITVTTVINNQVGAVGGLPESILTALKVNPF